MKQETQDPIVLTGYTYVTGALADIFQSRELVAGRAKVGDMKLWAQSGERVWTGQFRAAVFDGKKWRTFRLNIVADSDARYDSLDNRVVKARRCFAAIGQLKDQTARYHRGQTASDKGSYGCTFTLKARTAPAPVPATVSDTKPATAARTAPAPALGTGTKSPAPKRKRKRGENPDQLTLF